MNRGKCLALVAVLAMVVCAFAIAMPAGDSDAAETPEKVVTVNPSVSTETDQIKKTITGALGVSGVTKIILAGDVTEDVVIPAATTVTLDLNGKTLTNSADHTISNKGTLTIMDSSTGGKVINKTAEKAVIANYIGATITVESGTFEKQSTWYAVNNHGDITVKGGTFTTNDNGSSMFKNGWYDGTASGTPHVNDLEVHTTDAKATLKIDKGSFSNGLNTVKNDDFGVLTITGGTFKNTTQADIHNNNTLTITGGSFEGDKVSVTTRGWKASEMNTGKVEISGGSYASPVVVNTKDSADASSITIKGEVTIPGITAEFGQIDVAKDAKLTLTGDTKLGAEAELKVEDKGTVINKANIDNGGTLTINGSLDNEGSLVNEEGSSVTGEDNISGNKPAKVDGTSLVLDNYNGSFAFKGKYTEIILIGENKITLEDKQTAIWSTYDGKVVIKSIDGIGSLEIVMNASDKYTDDMYAIAVDGTGSNGELEINGVPVTITITGQPSMAYGIWTEKGFSIYDSTLNMTVCEESYTAESWGYGISAPTIDIKSSMVTISAGFTGLLCDDVSIAASKVTVYASEFGIESDGTVIMSNASVVTLDVAGLSEINAGGAYGLVAGCLNTQSDSVLTTNGIYVYGISDSPYKDAGTNNATVINNGDMIIESGVKYTNKASFTNNGTIGIYGIFDNNAGQFVNNGNVSSFDMKAGTINVLEVTQTSGTNNIKKIMITWLEPLADGTFGVKIVLTMVDDTATFKKSPFFGVMTYSNGKYTIEASTADGNGSLSISFEDAADAKDCKFDIFLSAKLSGDSGGTYDFELDVKSGSEDASTPVTGTAITKTAMKTFMTSMIVENTGNGILDVTGGLLTNSKAIDVKALNINGGQLVNDGTMSVVKLVMEKGKLSGNDITVAEGADIKLAGEVDIGFAYSGEYTSGTGSSATTVKFDDCIDVSGKVIGVAFKAAKNGVFEISMVGGATASSALTVESGKAVVKSTAVGSNMVLQVLSGATLEVEKSATVESTAGVVAIQDGAVFNMKVKGDRQTYNYGEVTYTISFANNGYTYYGSLQYALANAAEGSTLNLSSNASITTTTAVKKGITLQFGEGVTLSVSGTAASKTALTMGDGASFALAKDAKVSIAEADAKYVTVSGTFSYDGNVLVLDKAMFSTEVTINETVAGKSSASSVNLTGTAVDGSVTASKGNMGGDVKLGTGDSTAASMTVSSGVVCNAKVSVAAKTVLTVDGTLNLSGDKTFEGKVTGLGEVVLADGAVLAFSDAATADVQVSNSGDNSSVDFEGAMAGKGKTLTVTSHAKTASTAGYLAVGGDLYKGIATFYGPVSISANVQKDAVAVVPAESVLTVSGAQVSAIGLVRVAGTINRLIEGDATTSGYGKLDYQITYSDGSYTVYTYLSTGVNNAKAGDSFTIEMNLDMDEDMIIPAGVTITVAEGKAITLKNGHHISVGTAATTLGAVTGVTGKIVLEGNSFVVVYADSSVDMSNAKIVTGTGAAETMAKDSQFSILETLYATVYIGPSPAGNNVKDVVVPEIVGYRFVEWFDVKDGSYSPEKVGTIDFYAKMTASKVQVVFKNVEGLTYYVDGQAQRTVGAPVYVNYGSVITAVANYGYEGTALVNGQSYITVTSSLSEVVGSGVTKSSSGSSGGNGGAALTDILLIVLVVLIAVMAIMVALRMMRS